MLFDPGWNALQLAQTTENRQLRSCGRVLWSYRATLPH